MTWYTVRPHQVSLIQFMVLTTRQKVFRVIKIFFKAIVFALELLCESGTWGENGFEMKLLVRCRLPSFTEHSSWQSWVTVLWLIHTAREWDWDRYREREQDQWILKYCTEMFTFVGPIVSYCVGPVPCTCSGPVPFRSDAVWKSHETDTVGYCTQFHRSGSRFGQSKHAINGLWNHKMRHRIWYFYASPALFFSFWLFGRYWENIWNTRWNGNFVIPHTTINHSLLSSGLGFVCVV